jgi:hypothetical protein
VLKEQSLKDTFVLVHKLEKYGALTEEIKSKLNKKFGDKTTYFSEWSKSIDSLSQTEWGHWWLSEYDRLREEK